MRLILVSFATMAVFFYELSGGADFQPPSPPVIVAQKTAVPVSTPQPVRAAPVSPQVNTTTLLAAPAIAPRQTAPVAEVEAVATDPENGPANEPSLRKVRVSLSQGLTLLPETNPNSDLSLATLGLGASGFGTATPRASEEPVIEQVAAPAPVPETAPSDLRETTGARVNMRDGPGTIYPVVARLGIGHQVEILGDSGTGWLRLRTLPDRQLGWVSSSLISKAAR